MTPGLAASGYRLDLSGEGCRIEHSDAGGLHAARATLEQLHRQCGDDPPAVAIRDAPAIATRGVLLDCSRGRVPDADQRAALLDLVTTCKGNHLQLYTEHTLALPGHDAVTVPAGAIDLDELTEFGIACSRSGVALAACLNGLGHAERWLEHPDYAELGELPDVAARLAAGEPGPFSFNPEDPRVRELVTGWLQAALPCCPASIATLGLDECVDLGQGRSAAAVARDGVGTVWARYAVALAARCRALGKRPAAWADMMLAHPDCLPLLPRDLLALVWWYEADGERAQPAVPRGENHFEVWGSELEAAGLDWWACPGTAAWRSVLGRSTARSGSIAAAVAAGSPGLLVAEWGDCGHGQAEPVARLGLAEALGRAWNPSAAVDWAAISLQVFGDRSLRIAAWLDAAGRVVDRCVGQVADPRQRDGRRLINADALFADQHYGVDAAAWLPDRKPWQALAEQIDALAASRPTLTDADAEDALTQALQRARAWTAAAIAKR